MCLAAQRMEEPWLWHACYGHLSFNALGKLEKMVRGLPHIEHTCELCDSCLAGKQRRLPFSKMAKYRVAEALGWSTVTSMGQSRQRHMEVASISSCW